MFSTFWSICRVRVLSLAILSQSWAAWSPSWLAWISRAAIFSYMFKKEAVVVCHSSIIQDQPLNSDFWVLELTWDQCHYLPFGHTPVILRLLLQQLPADRFLLLFYATLSLQLAELQILKALSGRLQCLHLLQTHTCTDGQRDGEGKTEADEQMGETNKQTDKCSSMTCRRRSLRLPNNVCCMEHTFFNASPEKNISYISSVWCLLVIKCTKIQNN